MQLYALDQNNQLVPANRAVRQKNYFCLECNKQIRLRGGIHRQNHYYHTEPNRACKLGGKSLTHLSVQSYFQSTLPEGDCLLEHRFPRVNRIADAVWTSKKIVFEIQVSPITAEEIRQRNTDYSSMGYQVVWILHDKQFNKHRVTAAEIFLQENPHYFTNIDANGHGKIYDSIRHFDKKFEVDITQPTKNKRPIFKIPKNIDLRIQKWPISFEGDIISSVSDKKYRPYFDQFLDGEKPKLSLIGLWHEWIVRPYFIFFQIILERSCR